MMGELRMAVEKSADFDDAMKKRIKDANTRRNHLAHGYWVEQAFATKEGREKMIAELTADADTFEKLSADIHEATKPIRVKLGIKEEVLDERVENQMAKIREGLPLK